MTISYDGSSFHGWQRQPGKRTVQGEIEAALGLVCGGPASIHGVSRTDAGVHALGQRAGFVTEVPIPAHRLKLALNNLLSGGRSGRGGDIAIKSVQLMGEGFHARHSATGKTYLYRMLTSSEPDVFLRNYFWRLEGLPDPYAMSRGAAFLTGTHDFRSFRSSGGNEGEPTVKTVREIRIWQEALRHPLGPEAPGSQAAPATVTSMEVTGGGFLYNMVRIMAGTLAEVGLGRREPESVGKALAVLDRQAAGPTAPPQGLCLAKVHYAGIHGIMAKDG